MADFSLLPYGLLQIHPSVSHGIWFARSAEFLQSPALPTLVWMRAPGDIVFGAGAVLRAVFVGKLWAGGRRPLTAADPAPTAILSLRP
jgi:nitric oxide reductase subunit B